MSTPSPAVEPDGEERGIAKLIEIFESIIDIDKEIAELKAAVKRLDHLNDKRANEIKALDHLMYHGFRIGSDWRGLWYAVVVQIIQHLKARDPL